MIAVLLTGCDPAGPVTPAPGPTPDSIPVAAREITEIADPCRMVFLPTLTQMLHDNVITAPPIPGSDSPALQHRSCIWHGATKRPEGGVYGPDLVVMMSRFGSAPGREDVIEAAIRGYEWSFPARHGWTPTTQAAIDQASIRLPKPGEPAMIWFGLRIKNVTIEIRYYAPPTPLAEVERLLRILATYLACKVDGECG